MRSKLIKLFSVLLSIVFLSTPLISYGAVVVEHSNTSETAINVTRPPKSINYTMSRGLNRNGKYIVDSSKWFKYTAESSAFYEFRVSTSNTNRKLSLYIYESENGSCKSQPLYTDISNAGANCVVSICAMLKSGATYYVNCVSVVENTSKEPSVSNVNHTFYLAQHNHNLSYQETSDENSINEYCTVPGCLYTKSYSKINGISVSSSTYIYDGTVKHPTVTIKNKAGQVVDAKYYTITYSSGCKSVGSYTVTAKFKQPYASYLSADGKTVKFTANLSATFKILPKAEKITLSTTSYTYNGSEKKPSVTISDSSGNKVNTSYYSVTRPSTAKNVGKYTVKATLKPPYSGTKSASFKILPTPTSISSVTAGSKSFTLKWTKKTTQVTGYQFQYSASSQFTSSKYITITNNSTVSKTASTNYSNKKYYVRIRTYKTVGGTKYYSSWSSIKSVTTK